MDDAALSIERLSGVEFYQDVVHLRKSQIRVSLLAAFPHVTVTDRLGEPRFLRSPAFARY